MGASTKGPLLERREVRPLADRNDQLARRLCETEPGSLFVLRKDADGTPPEKLVFDAVRRITWVQVMETLAKNGRIERKDDGQFKILESLSLNVLNSVVQQGVHEQSVLSDSDVGLVEKASV